MRVLIAGASGAIGRALVRRLRANQHEVFALTQSHDSGPALKENGAEPVIANALDGAAVKAHTDTPHEEQRRSGGPRPPRMRNREWSRGESNPRPLECDSSALPAELRPHMRAVTAPDGGCRL